MKIFVPMFIAAAVFLTMPAHAVCDSPPNSSRIACLGKLVVQLTERAKKAEKKLEETEGRVATLEARPSPQPGIDLGTKIQLRSAQNNHKCVGMRGNDKPFQVECDRPQISDGYFFIEPAPKK